jgi:glucose/arabinose dehydrogenase
MPISKRRYPALLLALFVGLPNAAPYQTLTTKCDGLAQLPVVTLDGLCLGLVAQKSAELPFKMPRTLIELPDGKLLVTDMGGWAANRGKLWLLDYRAAKPVAIELLSGLNLPHKILYGPKGKIYLGEAHRIVRFAVVDGKVAALETLIDNLPHHSEYLHPLKNFAFDSAGNFVLNIGSSSDRCEKKVSIADCVAGIEASVRRYRYDSTKDTWDPKFELLGRGLRNSMALVVHASGTVLQAENSIDLTDADEPYEEINVLADGAFYGWPLCYDRDAGVDGKRCTAPDYRAPWTLLPPHVAPLDAIYYQHSKLPQLNRRLLMSWHGYRVTGSRLVAFTIDDVGRPTRGKSAQFWRAPTTPEGAYTQHSFAPTGNLGLVSQATEVISQWHEVPGLRPEGAPVGISQARDGSLFIVDDRNAAILRLSTGSAYRPEKIAAPPPATAAINLPARVRSVLQARCAQCHVELKDQPQRLLTAEKWLLKTDGITRMEQKLFLDKARPMPPDAPLSDVDKKILQEWLKM